ncbi:MAG TPA: FAD-binding oxidoreductase [Frankiaceae bacterium]|jgi:decaprenylphospho-beta-D-ribofuranose 2-oxidase|nr:FAD-binding oxidoreductase [Frankiaceae bacterium]
MTQQLLTGWGMTAATRAEVCRPTTAEEVSAALAAGRAAGHGVIPRGLGRAYGDASQNAGGTVLDLTGFNRVHAFDEGDAVAAREATITVDAGISLDALMRLLVPLGYFVPVTPGTRYVTVGGAIGSDIHGKGHHLEGSFCQHVESMTLLLACGETRVVRPDSPDTAAAFWATAGGMGLTGIVLTATVRLRRIASAFLRVDTERADNLDDCMQRMSERDGEYRYSAAWIDSLTTGSAMGRAVLTRGDFAAVDELPAKHRQAPLAYGPSPKLAAPPWVPGGLLRTSTVRAFNEVWFRKAPRRHTGYESIPYFFHPLDGVLEWNRIYGRSGFIQYQFAVPLGAEQTVRAALGELAAARCPSFLTVLKRFGPGNPGPLSFPIPGWTLTVDVPAALPGLSRLLDGLDQRVVEAGGRVYLSKDSRLRPDLLASMYPRLGEWRAERAALDPGGVLHSDLSRRLRLT